MAVEAIERCLHGMQKHLPPNHPERAFYQQWLSKALRKQAAATGESGGKASRERRRALERRAKEVAVSAADALAMAYGADHPTVELRRSGGEDGWYVNGEA